MVDGDGVLVEVARRELERRLCLEHPAFLLERMSCVDATSGEVFRFCLLSEEERGRVVGAGLRWDGVRDYGWFWQRGLLDEWLGSGKHVCLKARQLGVSWLACGLALWVLLFKPGSRVLAVSIKESDAVKLVNRVWDMLLSLPEWLWCGARVLKPSRGARPSSSIELVFPDGRVSVVESLTSSPSAGHGTTAALVVLDEFARQEYARDTWKAVLPTTQGGGRVVVISTGNGVSSPGGGGNFFHEVWSSADVMGVSKRFLPWSLHPGRDDEWYRLHAMALPAADRGEQYPRDEDEAFILTGRPFFDRDSLAWYRSVGVREPLFRFDFEACRVGGVVKGVVRRWEHGLISVFEEPVPGRLYGLASDVSTGRGRDFSAAFVVDLSSAALVAQLRGKLGADQLAEQLHFLGRMYNTARLAVENQGGWGEPVIIALRDGRSGRPRYPNLYRHVLSSRADEPVVKPYGFPMTAKTRPLVVSQIERFVRDRLLPYMSDELWNECRTFVHRESHPSPAAEDGANDDCVMAAAIALELFRLFGEGDRAPRRRVARQRSASELIASSS